MGDAYDEWHDNWQPAGEPYEEWIADKEHAAMSKFSELDIDRQNAAMTEPKGITDMREYYETASTWVTLDDRPGTFHGAKQSVRTVVIGFSTDGAVCMSVRNDENEYVGDFNLPAPHGDRLRSVLFDE